MLNPSGGSPAASHFVIDEELDRRLIDAMARRDEKALIAEPESSYQSGTSEIKNWITAAGILEGFQMRVVDYLPCYRSEAGTGSGLGFAVWS